MIRGALLLALVAGCGNDIKLDQGSNQEPVADILAPQTEQTFTDVQSIEFQGTVADGNGQEDLGSVLWSSSIDGPLGDPENTAPDANGITLLSTNLSVGIHTVTLTATDRSGATGQDAISVIIVVAEQDPLAEISSPSASSSVFTILDSIPLIGSVSDPQEEPEGLEVEWSIELFDGGSLVLPSLPPTSTGVTSATWTDAPIGIHQAVLTVTDADGNFAFDRVELNVIDPGSVDADADGVTPNGGDCDDSDPTIHRGAIDLCGNSVDDDCNGIIDDKDVDVDLHIDLACAPTTDSTTLPADDCDDGDAAIFPGATETLDGTDEDCNGLADDGTDAFDDDGDCFCEVAPCIDGIEPSCVTLEGGDCDDADILTWPGPFDVPDANYRDDDCDGIDGHAATATFVAPSGIDAGFCTINAPCASIEYGSLIADISGFTDIYVAAGTYGGILQTLPDGVHIYGGYDATWDRAGWGVAGHEVRLNGGGNDEGPAAGGIQFMVVRARFLTTGVHFADLVIDAPDAIGTVSNAGKSSYGVHAIDSTVVLERVKLEGGRGADGIAGSSGSSASAIAAAGGSPGGSSQSYASSCNTSRVGGGGGASNGTCGGRTAGGAGGSGGTMDTSCGWTGFCSNCNAQSGLWGASAPTEPGYGYAGFGGGTCGGGVGNGGSGLVTNGVGGGGGAGEGFLLFDFWLGTGGATASGGLDGTGGGGGGGSGGCDNGTDDTGAGGGGGGAGGCAGSGGAGGGAGGGSFPVFAINGTVELIDCTVVRGDGGTGANGGAGGAGQPGGAGGGGGGASLDTANGGNGGNGAAGGAGGGAGGGGGGLSFGAYTLNTAVIQSGTQFSGGAGGAGGGAGSSTGDAGDAGGLGLTGDLGTCASAGGC